MSDTLMRAYMAENPRLKYIFFGGKGGVGKTVLAGTAALWSAQQGKRTLLASTNPVHSLSSLLDQNVFGKPTQVSGVPNLHAYEIDTRETIEKSKKEIREKIEWFLKFAEIKTKADEFVESATMNPAFEESAMFENMIDLMFEDKYEAYVFDTAPTANARRLLGMSSVYSMWVNKMMKSREEAKSLRELLSYSRKKQEKDPMFQLFKKIFTNIKKSQAFHFFNLGNGSPAAGINKRQIMPICHNVLPVWPSFWLTPVPSGVMPQPRSPVWKKP